MLDYNNDKVNSNNVPSLRQKMIDEALNYHQNMNSVVFKRQAKNVEVYNKPSGKSDPSQGDVLVEGNIRQRVGDLQSAIQRLNQVISYSNNVTLPRAVTPLTRGVPHVGHGRFGGARVKRQKPPNLKNPKRRQELSGIVGAPEQESSEVVGGPERESSEIVGGPGQASSGIVGGPERASSEIVIPQRRTRGRPKGSKSKKVQSEFSKAVSELSRRHRTPSEESHRSSGESYPSSGSDMRHHPMFTSFADAPPQFRPRPKTSSDESDVSYATAKELGPYPMFSSFANAPSQLRQRPRTISEESYPYSGESYPSTSSDIRHRPMFTSFADAPHPGSIQSSGLPSGSPPGSIQSGTTNTTSVPPSGSPPGSIQSGTTNPTSVPTSVGPSEGSDPEGSDPEGDEPEGSDPEGDEPPAPGVLSTTSPDAKNSTKIKQLIDNSLAAIVSSYNSLIDFIDLQIRQRSFKQRDEQSAATQLKDLLSPLKLLISNSAQLRNNRDGLIEYSRVYNVLSDLTNKIQSCPPFLKVDAKLLTEALPLRRDIISSPDYDAEKASNHQYLVKLVDRLKDAYDDQIKFHPKSQLEKEARTLKLKEIEDYMHQLSSAGYKPSTRHAVDLAGKLSENMRQQMAADPTLIEMQAISDKRGLNRDIQDIEDETYDRVNELEDLERTLMDIRQRKEEAHDHYSETSDVMDLLREEHQKIEDEIQEYYEQQNNELQYAIYNFPDSREVLEQQFDRNIDRVIAPFRHRQFSLLEQYQEMERMQSDIRDDIDTYENDIPQLEELILANNDRIGLLSHEQDKLKDIKALDKPARKSYKSKIATKQRLEAENPVIQSKFTYHANKFNKDLDKRFKRAVKMQKYSAKAQIPMEGPFGEGKPKTGIRVHKPKTCASSAKAYGGMRPHKPSADPFGDNPELEPYLTKYLRPSKFRQVKDVPPIESSSDESSGEDEPKTVKKRGAGSAKAESTGVRGKRNKKLKEDFKIIEAQLHPDKAILIEKKIKTKRIGRGKVIESTKPAHTTAPSADLWFM